MIRLASSPALFAARSSRSLLTAFRTSNMFMAPGIRTPDLNYKSETAARPIPAPEPDPEPNPQPDGVKGVPRSLTTNADWDKLFYALAARLEGCANSVKLLDQDSQLPGTAQSAQAIVLECLFDLKHLHVALVRARNPNEH